MKKLIPVAAAIVAVVLLAFQHTDAWNSRYVKPDSKGQLVYAADKQGNTIPDFSRVGYHGGDKPIPDVPVVKIIQPATTGSSAEIIQSAIDEVSRRNPDQNGFRGTILLKKGTYIVPDIIRIKTSGIVLRGEGDSGNGTNIVSTATKQVSLLTISGEGKPTEVPGTRVDITDAYVPVGAKSFTVERTSHLKVGDRIMVFQPTNDQWVKDLKMDQIVERPGTKQWKASEYSFQFERIITGIEKNKIFLDNPVVSAIDKKYGGGQIYRYTYEGRISEVGVEQIRFISSYESDTAENHAWNAVQFDKIENGWARNISSRFFGNSCVTLENYARNISVLNSTCLDAKSVITGGRRYSFNNTGQLNLFMYCQATEGRHDFVTGARVCGPNAFVHCSATNTHSDIGPHHRWAIGTLYDNITTDGEINVQDRGNWGSGHGWAGITQIIWNCTARKATVQSPWAVGKNYCIGLKGEKNPGRFKDRPDGEWEGHNRRGLEPASLYEAQLRDRKKR